MALCGAAGIAALYAIALNLLRDRTAAACAALLVVFNQTYFIQARIAMLEMPMMACLLIGAACLLNGKGQSRSALVWRYAGALFLGLAVASKWLAIPYFLAFIGLAGWRQWSELGKGRQNLIERILPDTARLAAIGLATYLATFWPAFFYDHEPLTLRTLVGFQFEMLDRQRAPMAAHPYQSDWWQWPVMLRPIWYLFEKTDSSYRAVLLIGNPVVYWGGLLLVVAALSGWFKSRTPAIRLLLGCYLLSVAIWIVIPKPIGFFYYYNLSAVALCLLMAAILSAGGKGGHSLLKWTTAASCAMFAYFYPVISAQPLPADDTWTNWVWMQSWF